MWNEFMQMSAPAAFVLAVALSAVPAVTITAIVSRTKRLHQEQEHLIDLRKTASGAKVIEAPKRAEYD